MILEGKRIFVTGADGFIGSHLVEALIREGCEVQAFVLYNSFSSWGWLDHLSSDTLKKISVISGDVQDFNSVKMAMNGCDVVMHLAALISIPYSYQSPYSYLNNNVTGTLNVLQAARDLKIERVLHTSSSEVYGTAQFVPMTEEHPLQAQSPYAATKIGADQMALSFYLSHDTPVAVIRPFNTYGPRQSNRALIPTIITQIASGAKSIQLGALTPTRDFNYIADTVQGFISIASADECVGQVTNIGSGFEISVRDTAQLIAEVMDAQVEFVSDEQRFRPENSEVERLVASTAKAGRLSGWKPAYTGREGLRKGLTNTVVWFTDLQNIKLYKPSSYNI